MANARMFRLQVALFLILFSICFSDSDDRYPYSNQPRIVVKDGVLQLHGAMNGNIYLITKGNGKMFFGSEDALATFPETNTLNTNFDETQRKVSQIIEQMSVLEENITSIESRINRFIGTGQDRLSNRALRRFNAKVQALQEKVNTLTQLLTENECNSNPCRNGGTCVDTYNGFICNCPSNWEGATCENDVNECARFAGTSFGCQNGATCINNVGGYSCTCPPNWYGIHCTQQHDDCSSASHQELCGHGTCIDEKRAVPGQPRYRCICDPGWQSGRNGPACTEDIDECSGAERRCSLNPPVTCINLPGTFHCGQCPAGYTGNGISCSDINECELNNGGCSVQPFVQCSNTVGSRVCGPCPTGYVGNGVYCTFVGVCNTNRGGCHPLATCIENTAITGTYRECRCPSGYTGSGEGPNGCLQTAGLTCDNNPCRHGTCLPSGQSFRCVCSPGYLGTLCDQEEIDVCFSSPCENGGTCVRTANSFRCVCPAPYEGPTCAERGGKHYVILNGTEGEIASPGFPNTYHDTGEYHWTVYVPSGMRISVRFLAISITTISDDYQSTCRVEIFDGMQNTDPSLGEFSGFQIPDPVVSTGNVIHIVFYSHQYYLGNFHLKWIAITESGIVVDMSTPTDALASLSIVHSKNNKRPS
ncbi:cubilin [Trichonephila inaurata madagascariensis]|uniref:Cubilin n=1 Tax=Trichonephila inaurata madagascariensis TaxID=2747483 RepID=A0A8X6YBA9_9ARAC|nr:cubilin [Trichonephila inaurata madagascariensis]